MNIGNEAGHFFSKMEEFGFFEDVEHHLPEQYSAVYEIARIFENEMHPLTERLSPILRRQKDDKKKAPPPQKLMIPVLTESEEYESDLIRSFRDVLHIYPHQFLLPDEVFYQKLAERTLVYPRPIPPNNFRYQVEGDDFAPDSRKQKVYVLLDTSSSMVMNHRIHVAKAIAYFFLRHNMKELGMVFFRTFDVEIGQLKVAKDKHTFEQLIEHVLEIDTLGNGTAMSKAIQTAVEDMRKFDEMAESEILIITDGAVHLDLDKMRALLGESITVNTIKIGKEKALVNPVFVRDQIELGNSDQSRLLQKLHHRAREVQSKFQGVGSDQRKHQLEEELNSINKQIASATEQLTAKISESYGMEIQDLSKIYIPLDDIEPKSTYHLPEIRILDLDSEMKAMIKEISDHVEAEAVKKAALMYNHVRFLQQFNEDEKLEETSEELKNLLEKILAQDEEMNADSQNHFSINDQNQIQKMLKTMTSKRKLPFAVLLRYWFARTKRKFNVWKQRRRYRKLG